MLVHYSGFILGENLSSFRESYVPYVKGLPYFLSTESLFCHEMLNSYWTFILIFETYPSNLFNMNLMGNTQYYIDTFLPVSYEFPPYKQIKLPIKKVIYNVYSNLLTEW